MNPVEHRKMSDGAINFKFHWLHKSGQDYGVLTIRYVSLRRVAVNAYNHDQLHCVQRSL